MSGDAAMQGGAMAQPVEPSLHAAGIPAAETIASRVGAGAACSARLPGLGTADTGPARHHFLTLV